MIYVDVLISGSDPSNYIMDAGKKTYGKKALKECDQFR